MNEEKQISEMAKDLCHLQTCEIKKNGGNCYKYCKAYIYAFRAINAGYRKQSEWISVEERLPEQHKEVLVVCLGNVGTDFIATNGRWYEHDHWFITHWMPLPEPPKMKG